MKELKELWDGIVQGAVLPEGAVSLWLTTCVPVSLEEDDLVVDTSNPSTDMVSVTLDSLAYTNASEQAAGARSVRVSSGGKEILTKDLDLTVDPTGPTTGRVDFNLTFPSDAPTRACRTIQTATCRWASVETLDSAGTVLNRFSVEIEDEAAADPGAETGDSTAEGTAGTADEAGGEATSTP